MIAVMVDVASNDSNEMLGAAGSGRDSPGSQSFLKMRNCLLRKEYEVKLYFCIGHVGYLRELVLLENKVDDGEG